MCGIAGWIDFAGGLQEDSETIKKMTDSLSHRGPDAEGYWLSKTAALGHRRLIVVDPEGGAQPMLRRKGAETFVMVYNGELYNTEDIRRELKEKGVDFVGWSDTEVLMCAYMQWGEACLEKLNGIFAFAVWESKAERLFLARDRIGVKPLFYCEKKGSLIFGSEIKAILSHPSVSPTVGCEGLAEIFAIGPARTPGHGVFEGISELRPGHCMTIDKSKNLVRRYWTLESRPHEDDFEKTVRTVRELVTDAIERQLVSDVPLCTLLSGGLDSSAISAVAAAVYKKEGRASIRTFSVDYVGNDENFRASEFQPNTDDPWVKIVSDYLGTRHSSCFIDTPELVEALFPAVTARDLPGMTDVDSSLLIFSRWIKGKATVGLSGECADEVFGGYPWFYSQVTSNTFPWSQKMKERTKLYSPELTNLIRPDEYVARRFQETLSEVPRLQGEDPQGERKRELFYMNLTRWMPTLLDRKDRMSMATGLELRVPYCDHRVVEYVWNVPWEMKNYNNREKGILRHALAGLLPEDVLWRKKSPYPKTHNPDYLEAMRSMTLEILNDSSSPLLPFVDRQKVRDLAMSVDRDTNIPWFGQLMNAPQLLAFLVQVDFWLRKYKIAVM